MTTCQYCRRIWSTGHGLICPKCAIYQEEGSQEKLKAMLKKKFDEDVGFNNKGRAHIHVSVIGIDGQRYGSYKWVRESSLIGRDVKYEYIDYEVGILVLDSEYNPKGRVWSRPI